jgi:hypothetical protein
MLIGIWFAAFILLIAGATALSARGRATPSGLVGRWSPAGVAVALAALAALAVWAWGGAVATDGRAQRLRDGVPVRMSVAGVAVEVGATPLTVGWQSGAGLRLVGDVDDAAEVARLARAGDVVSVEPAAASTILVKGRGTPGEVATRAYARGPTCAVEPTPGVEATGVTVGVGEVVVAIACRGGSPRAAVAVKRGERLEVVPLRWRGRFVPSSLEVKAGDVLQLGAVGVALPGVLAWEIPAPAGQGALLAVPADPTDCAAWAGALGESGSARAVGGRCVVGDDTFTLDARPIAPDAAGVLARGVRAAIALAAPSVLLLLCFAAAAGSRRRARVMGALARVAVLAAGLTALVAWRLLWAHRIDVLRDLDVDGARVAANVLSAALVGASLAGVAVSRLVDGALARVAAALLAWVAWAAVSLVLLDASLELDVRTGGQLALSLIGAIGLPIVERVLAARSFDSARFARYAQDERGRATAATAHTATNNTATATATAPAATAAPASAAATATATATAPATATATATATAPATATDADADADAAAAAAAAAAAVPAAAAAAVPAAAAAAAAAAVPAADADAAAAAAAVPRRPLVSRLGPGHALLAIAAAATAARLLAPHLVLAKLGLAYAAVIAGHAALRAALRTDGPTLSRAFHAAALVPALVALAALDAGVAVVIGGVGLALAMIVAGHDAVYDAAAAPRLGVLEREHARLVALHGVFAIGAALAATTWAVVAGDQDLLERSTTAVLHAPLVAAVLFACAAIVARTHHRPWAPWLAGALAALALWGARDLVIQRAAQGDSVAAHRVAVVVDPGYALLRDDHRFVASVSAWREASLPDDVDVWTGQGYFGARLADPGVVVSVENDYLPVLVARERGVGGLVQTTLLLLALVVAAGATAAARLGHATRAHRARWMVAAVVGALCVYQPLASLGVLPLTGISWPGLGIDSPADLWLFALGAIWLFLGADATAIAGATPVTGRAGLARATTSAAVALASIRAARAATHDERIRTAPRLRRARRIAAVSLALAAAAGVGLVARAGASALGRGVTAARRGAASGDARIDRALAYASTIACPAADRTGARPDDVVPASLAATPSDPSTTRFDRELAATWAADRPALLARLADGACTGRAGAWSLATDAAGACHAELDAGWPSVHLVASRTDAGWRATCAVELPDDAVPQLDPHRPPRAPRIRLVSAPIGVAAGDLGELVSAGAVIRLRATAPAPAAPAPDPAPATTKKKRKATAGVAPVAPPSPFAATASFDATTATPGLHVAATVDLGGGATLAIRAAEHDVVVTGAAEILVASAATADAPTAWRRQPATTDARVLDRMALVIAGAPGHRRVWLFRPPRAFGPDVPAAIDPLLADDVRRAGDRARRTYTYGAALPELGWTNPFDVDHSLGLDGWVHAALADRTAEAPGRAAPSPVPVACGTLAPPAIARERVCAPSPLDGVIECRVALQPELALALREITEKIVADPQATIGRSTAPTRAAYVVMRGDTGELLAQGDVIPGRGASAYAPVDAAAETALIRLREDRDPRTGAPTARGESDGERADWSLPIAVGSTLKPLVARAAEQAFPQQIGDLLLTSIGRADTACRRGKSGRVVPPMMGHCPPTTLSGDPTTADLHDFIARSPNWYMAALGLIGLGLPNNQLAVGDTPITLSDIVMSDLAAWPTERPLTISDAGGPVLTPKGVVVAGLRRTPLWSRFEAVLGRPMCTLGDQGSCRRAADRNDVCAARALPVPELTRDLRHLVSLGPDRFDFYGDDRPDQRTIATREYFQLLRGSGVHSIGSLAQLVDAFGRVVYDPTETGALQLAASWFPSPPVGVTPAYRCTDAVSHAPSVRGAEGGLCAVMQPGGTAHAALSPLLADPRVAIYGGKTGTIDSLADIARRPKACAAWNTRHTVAGAPLDLAHQPGWLDCGAVPPDDSLFVLAFGVTTAKGTIPITVGVQLQRGGKGTAAKATRLYVDAIAAYLQ